MFIALAFNLSQSQLNLVYKNECIALKEDIGTILSKKSSIMPLRFDLMFLAASLRMTVMTLTGIVKTCSTLRFPPERISQRDFPSMFATWTPTLSLGGNKTFGGNYIGV